MDWWRPMDDIWMTNEEILKLQVRVSKVLKDGSGAEDYYYTCVIVSDLSSVPFERVFEVCIEEA
jgi:hypothetical protein